MLLRFPLRAASAAAAGGSALATYRASAHSEAALPAAARAADGAARPAAPRSLWVQLNDPPPFDSAAASRFDLSTYGGRALHFIITLGDISTLLITGDALKQHQRILKQHAERPGSSGATDAELWRARQVVGSSAHPETGAEINPLFRFTAFAPTNLVICMGLLRPNPTLASAAFWQWINQSYNAAVNWNNRSSGEEASMTTLASGYAAATGAALGIGVGCTVLARKLGASGRLVQLTVPMAAVTVSSVVNLAFMRQEELRKGVPVYTADGALLGTSAAAGRIAILKCSGSRVLWTIACLTAAPLLTSGALAVAPFIAASATATVALEGAVTFSAVWLSVPLCVAVWPQRDCAKVEDLEPQFKGATHPKTGARVTEVYFNRGL